MASMLLIGLLAGPDLGPPDDLEQTRTQGLAQKLEQTLHRTQVICC